MPAVVRCLAGETTSLQAWPSFIQLKAERRKSLEWISRDRRNANGDVVYDANWSDGYKSSYVFWRNGKVEIFSKDGNGRLTNMPGRFIADGNGGIVITAKSREQDHVPQSCPLYELNPWPGSLKPQG